MLGSKQRFAIYFAPDDQSDLARFGEVALKRKPNAEDSALGPVYGRDLTQHKTFAAFPRHYGFHATLKAPFELQDNTQIGKLERALEQFCCLHSPVPLTALKPAILAGFIALVCEPSASLKQLAFEVVKAFEPFRGPISEHDLQRRKPETLSPLARSYLHEYGYPYVGELFKFHMTLSGENDPGFYQFLKDNFDEMVIDPVTLDRVALFRQPHRDAPFERMISWPLTAAG